MEKEGKGLIEATLLVRGARVQSDDILAFILGVMPLVIKLRRRLQAQKSPFAARRNGGMVTATILAISSVPVFFVVVCRRFSKKSEDIEHSHQVEHLSLEQP
ncbi:hypothetical protein MJ579_06985 [Klebsiella pneumoniae]|nr:hypothetical protein MJ579_06985 [Klebsiella pneumoniae]